MLPAVVREIVLEPLVVLRGQDPPALIVISCVLHRRVRFQRSAPAPGTNGEENDALSETGPVASINIWYPVGTPVTDKL